MRYLISLLILIFPAWPVLAGDTVTAEDFAYGLPLRIEDGAAISSLIIPEEVYRTARRADLGDVRVFNGNGEAVPHLLRTAERHAATVKNVANIPFFPLSEDVGRRDEGAAAVHVERNADGLIVNLTADTAAGGSSNEKRTYLLDLTGREKETGKLGFIWREGPPLLAVRLLESDDLVHWHSLVDHAILADLDYGGHRIEQKTLVLPTRPLRYLKLLARDGHNLPDLQEVMAYSEKLAERKQRHWSLLADGQVVQNKQGLGIDYDAVGHPPVDRVKLHFPENNSMLRATVQSRPDTTSPWIPRCSTVFFALTVEGTAIENTLCSFEPVSDSHWRLEIIEDGAGLATSGRVPTLELGWTAAEVLFVARGPAPFTLAFGSGRAGTSDQPDIGMILQAVSGRDADHLISPAEVGERFDLGGQKALAAPPPPLPWKQWLLWAVLILGAVILAFMVRRLLHEMGSGN
jgi:hypothetical protein